VEQPVGASLDRSLTSRPETDDRADQEIDQFIARRHAQRRGSEDRGEAPWVESERRAQAARDARLRLEWSERVPPPPGKPLTSQPRRSHCIPRTAGQ
jgi:hypothetical protein